MRLTLPWPPTVNTYWRHTAWQGKPRVYVTAKGQAFRQDVINLCIASRIQEQPGRLRVSILANPPDKRARDLDNLLKATLDALEHAGAYYNDSQIDDLMIRRGTPIKGGAMVVEIEEIRD